MEEILSPLPPELSPHSQVLPSLTSSTSHLTSLMSDSPTSTSLLSSVLSSIGPDVGLPPALHQMLLSQRFASDFNLVEGLCCAHYNAHLILVEIEVLISI